MTEPEQTPPLTESARSVYEAARGVAGAWGGSFASFKRLLAADLTLARTAAIEGLVLLFIASILLGTAWVLLIALAVWAIHAAGAGWALAVGLPLLFSAGLGGFAFWKASHALRVADLRASRHEWSQWMTAFKETPQAPPPLGPGQQQDRTP